MEEAKLLVLWRKLCASGEGLFFRRVGAHNPEPYMLVKGVEFKLSPYTGQLIFGDGVIKYPKEGVMSKVLYQELFGLHNNRREATKSQANEESREEQSRIYAELIEEL